MLGARRLKRDLRLHLGCTSVAIALRETCITHCFICAILQNATVAFGFIVFLSFDPTSRPLFCSVVTLSQ